MSDTEVTRLVAYGYNDNGSESRKPMTVGDLRTILAKLPDDAVVLDPPMLVILSR